MMMAQVQQLGGAGGGGDDDGAGAGAGGGAGAGAAETKAKAVAAAEAAVAQVEALFVGIEAYTKKVCDDAAATVAAAAGAGSSRAYKRAVAVTAHCSAPALACTKANRDAQGVAAYTGAGCFGFAPGYSGDANGVWGLPPGTGRRMNAPSQAAADALASAPSPAAGHVLARTRVGTMCAAARHGE